MRSAFGFLAISIILWTHAAPGVAGELTTVTLDVDGMTCNMCPIAVKKALEKVEGVAEVIVKYEGRGAGWRRVTFDADKAGIGDLTVATDAAGYPSRLKR